MTCTDTLTFPPFSFLFHQFPTTQTDPTPKSQNPRNHSAPKRQEPVGHDRTSKRSASPGLVMCGCERRALCQNAVAEGGTGGGKLTPPNKQKLLLD
ncbi:hypothetical protein Q3G72_000120 [Acer saccharum]|nr:hypothetical protein Q3G72_000120 [Acer saccharum]